MSLNIKQVRALAMMGLPPQEWEKVRNWVVQELDKVRAKNDAIGLAPDETAAYRGEIRLLKRILDLPNKATREQVAPPTSM